MSRGDFGFLPNMSVYSNAKKFWYVQIARSECLWYDLVINPPEFIGEKNFISAYLAELKKRMAQIMERRFVYFFCSRPKVCFNTGFRPKFGMLSKNLMVELLIGRDKKRKKISVDIRRGGLPENSKPDVWINEKFIQFDFRNGLVFTYAIHDFIRIFHVNLGLPTTVHYVGKTRNPETRPIDRRHTGIADTIYNVSNEENDFFLIIIVFKVTSIARSSSYGLNFLTGNGLTDEVCVDLEGNVLEGGFLDYFSCPIQNKSGANERPSLLKTLEMMKNDLGIDHVIFDFDPEPPDEYLVLQSKNTESSVRHVFRCFVDNNMCHIESLSTDFSVQSYVNDWIEGE